MSSSYGDGMSFGLDVLRRDEITDTCRPVASNRPATGYFVPAPFTPFRNIS